MTENTGLTKTQIEQLVADFDANFKNPVLADIEANDNAIAGLHDKSADRTYDLIAALMDLAETLDVDAPTPQDGYKQFLLDRSLVPARGTNNFFLPFIKAVFSERVDGKWAFVNRSAEKYANALRHLIAAKRAGRLTGTIQNYIRSYDVEPYGKKLKGIEAQDRADNPSKGAADRVKALRNAGRNARPIVNVSHNFGIAAHKVVLLYGQVNLNGDVEVLKAKALNDDEADSFYYNLGRELTPAK